jgi:hypothetical protein
MALLGNPVISPYRQFTPEEWIMPPKGKISAAALASKWHWDVEVFCSCFISLEG